MDTDPVARSSATMRVEPALRRGGEGAAAIDDEEEGESSEGVEEDEVELELDLDGDTQSEYEGVGVLEIAQNSNSLYTSSLHSIHEQYPVGTVNILLTMEETQDSDDMKAMLYEDMMDVVPEHNSKDSIHSSEIDAILANISHSHSHHSKSNDSDELPSYASYSDISSLQSSIQSKDIRMEINDMKVTSISDRHVG